MTTASSTRWRWAGLLFLVLFGLHLWRLAFKRIEPNDEGMILYSSIQILDGKAPYRDVYVHTMGGAYCLQATACALLGRTVVAHRVVAWTAHMIIAALALVLGTRLLGSARGTIAAAIGSTCALPLCHLGHYTQWSIACILGAVLLDGRARISRRAFPAVGAGLLLAAAFWFKPNMGILGALALGIVHLVLLTTSSGRTSARILAGVTAGGLLGGVIVSVVPFARGTFRLMWEENFSREAVDRFVKNNTVPMPPIATLVSLPRTMKGAYGRYEAWLSYLPILVSLFGLAMVPLRRVRGKWENDDTTLLLLSLLVLALAANAYPRADRIHFTFALLPSSLLLAHLLGLWAEQGASRIRWTLSAGLLALVAVQVAEQFIVFRGNDHPLHGAAEGIWVRGPQADQIRRLQEWTDRYAPARTPILVVPDGSLWYMLLDRPDALGYGPAFFQAVYLRGAPAVLADLNAHPPALILEHLPPNFLPDSETWLKGIGFRARLDARYRIAEECDGFRAWVPK